MLVLAVATAGFDSIPPVRFDKLDDCPDFHRSFPELVREATRTQSGLAFDVSAVEDFDGIHAYDRAKMKGFTPDWKRTLSRRAMPKTGVEPARAVKPTRT